MKNIETAKFRHSCCPVIFIYAYNKKINNNNKKKTYLQFATMVLKLYHCLKEFSAFSLKVQVEIICSLNIGSRDWHTLCLLCKKKKKKIVQLFLKVFFQIEYCFWTFFFVSDLSFLKQNCLSYIMTLFTNSTQQRKKKLIN